VDLGLWIVDLDAQATACVLSMPRAPCFVVFVVSLWLVAALASLFFRTFRLFRGWSLRFLTPDSLFVICHFSLVIERRAKRKGALLGDAQADGTRCHCLRPPSLPNRARSISAHLMHVIEKLDIAPNKARQTGNGLL